MPVFNKTDVPFLRVVDSPQEFHQRVWQRDGFLFLHKDALFQDRCIVCNKEAGGKTVSKLLFWHTPVLLPLLLLSLPFYILLAFFFRRYLRVQIPLCAHHYRVRQLSSILGLSLFPTAVCSVVYAIVSGQPVAILLGIFSFLSGIAVLAWGRNPIWATEINEEYALVRGASPEFVSSYPEWTGVDHMVASSD